MLHLDATGKRRDRLSELTVPGADALRPLSRQGANLSVLMDALEGFVVHGLDAEEGVLVIATSQRLRELRRRLVRHPGYPRALGRGQLQQLEAGGTVGRFLVDGWPDAARFEAWLGTALTRAGGRERRAVRVYDEMVAFLARRGEHAATLRLEQLWQNVCRREERFSLLLASTRAACAHGFTPAWGAADAPRPEQYLG